MSLLIRFRFSLCCLSVSFLAVIACSVKPEIAARLPWLLLAAGVLGLLNILYLWPVIRFKLFSGLEALGSFVENYKSSADPSSKGKEFPVEISILINVIRNRLCAAEAVLAEKDSVIERTKREIENMESAEIVDDVAAELTAYSQRHFKYEEDLFDKHGYVDNEHHKSLHRNFFNKVTAFKGEVDAGRANPEDLVRFLKDWVVKHIKVVDAKYTPYLHENGYN